MNLRLVAGEKKPAISRLETAGIGLEHFRRVVFGISRDRDEPHIGREGDLLLQFGEAGGKQRAGPGQVV